jgi:Mg2+-importing ATPase
MNPDQKLHVISALQERGAVVGYLGDGINDAPPLHVADVGISVDNATDVARAAADVILLRAESGGDRPGRARRAGGPSPTRSSTSGWAPARTSATC